MTDTAIPKGYWADAQGNGEYAPMPPVLGPVSPSPMRL